MPEYDINLFLFTVCKIWGYLTILPKIIGTSLNSEGDEGGHLILRVILCLVVISVFVNISHSCNKFKKKGEHMVKIKVVSSSNTVVNLYHYTASYLGKCSF
jgi:hypothetical protein